MEEADKRVGVLLLLLLLLLLRLIIGLDDNDDNNSSSCGLDCFLLVFDNLFDVDVDTLFTGPLIVELFIVVTEEVLEVQPAC
jgi:hypothetical protein